MEELFMACSIGDYPTQDIRHYDTPVVVKQADQHPCDPPIGEVTDVRYNKTMDVYELIITPINE
jgi:hypothetical protein